MTAPAPRIRLRAMEPGDVDTLYLWENLTGENRHGGGRAPLSRHQLWEYARNYSADPAADGQLRLIGEFEDPDGQWRMCGVVDLYDFDFVDRRAMAGILVAPSMRRRGIGLALLAALAAYCLDTLSLDNLGAEVASDNAASLRLFDRSGWTHVGTRPGWYRRGKGAPASARLYQLQLD